jgi:hypothetical protein
MEAEGQDIYSGGSVDRVNRRYVAAGTDTIQARTLTQYDGGTYTSTLKSKSRQSASHQVPFSRDSDRTLAISGEIGMTVAAVKGRRPAEKHEISRLAGCRSSLRQIG